MKTLAIKANNVVKYPQQPDWLNKWKGRTFECNSTKARLTIPNDVHPKQFLRFGACFIDIGDEFCYRTGGDFKEVV